MGMCMNIWVYEHLAACTCVCMRVYMCVYMHACMYTLLYPAPPSIEVGLAGFSPPPRPPPPKKKKKIIIKIEKLPTPMTTLLTYAGKDLFFLSYRIEAINRWFTSVCLSVCTPGQCSFSFVCCPIYQILRKN